MSKVIIWDLDETLLDTSALKGARDNKNWGFVKKNLDKVRPYEGILEIYNKLKSNYKFAIVTNSPKWYAENLLSKFELNYDILLTYRSAPRRKPNPDPFLKVLSDLQIASVNALSIGDSIDDLYASLNANIKFIGVGWGSTGAEKLVLTGAPFVVKKPEEIFLIIANIFY